MTEKSVVEELSELLSSEGLPPLPPPTLEKFSAFYDLFVRWNGRTNLSAIRDRVGILRRLSCKKRFVSWAYQHMFMLDEQSFCLSVLTA